MPARLFPVAFLAVLAAAGTCAAYDWPELVDHRPWATGAWSCAATACHGGEKLGPNRVGGELDLWRNNDPHARAGSILESRAFAEILAKLAIVDPQALEAPLAGAGSRLTFVRPEQQAQLQECMNCHNPAGVPNSWSAEEVPSDPANDLLHDGLAISCETCHGPAKHWIADHYRRDFDRFEAAQRRGFHDLKDLVLRGRTCAQCHIGDGQRDMNHDMIAAGHPPLRFELASYERALPKHWNDRRDRTATPDYEVKLWLAGQIANFDGGLALTESRLRRTSETTEKRPHTPWPEFAEHRCSSCHQALRSPVEEGAELKPVDQPLMWSSWNIGLTESLLGEAFKSHVDDLRTKFDASLTDESADKGAVAERCQALRGEFRRIAHRQYPEVFTWSGRYELPLTDRLAGLLLPRSDYDHHLQAYAFVSALAKARGDEAVKSGRRPIAARAALGELAGVKPALVPRRFGDDSIIVRPRSEQIGPLILHAAERLESSSR